MEHLLPGTPDGSSITAYHLSDQEYDPAEGAISHLNYSEDRIQFNPPFEGAAIGTSLFLVQDGTRYLIAVADGVFRSETWERVRVEGLTEQSFVEGLDFSVNGAPIQFGFFRSNGHNASETGIVTNHAIDNWRFEICLE